MTDATVHPNRVPASQLVDDLADSFGDAPKVSVGELLKNLEGRGLGLLLIILALPICIPNIPGISTIFGLLLIGPSIQMILAHKALWMPGFIKRWAFKGETLRGAFRACGVVLRKVEFLTRPRLVFMTRGIWLFYAGLQTLLMALILLLPMPGANVIPGIAVVLTGLGLLQRDGLCLLLSVPVAAGAVTWVYYGARYVVDFALWAWAYVEGWFLPYKDIFIS
ncbi:exopolysaccharide biosynthesis protein [Asticcacaulis sp. AND118]|uniref:exopolysaccharide biosynthesis protein n=1 Tax=Asticcacaulis sp. AND118 TaxID=2840468 RepID=UPI001D0018E0|nr:exopolysaccharide biosynthesis protein [Asticcacaulis sp. AND118]UDF03368.1 exopolysaccharide biosynthesis protein [Asticcacaulis sp. AND118]